MQATKIIEEAKGSKKIAQLQETQRASIKRVRTATPL